MATVDTALTVQEESPDGLHAYMEHAPKLVLAEAHLAARALQDVIATKSHKVMMNGQQYLEFEDWQLIGRFYGITAGEVGEPEFVEFGPVRGFKVSSVALWHGREISRATAFCLSDEEKWSTRPKYEYHMVLKTGATAREEDSDKSDWVWEENPNKPGKSRPKRQRVQVGEEHVPLFQLASMAQTRANAKALRNVLSWVVELAGYKTTPAEELTDKTEVIDVEPTKAQPAGPEDLRNHPDEKPSATSTREPGSDDEPTPEQMRAQAIARTASPKCPKCRKSDDVMLSRYPREGRWYCNAKRGGCGHKFNAEPGQ
jgi:hypothetical protein